MPQTVSAALARKVSSGQQDLGDKPRPVLRALRLGLAREAGDHFQLPLTVIGAQQSDRDQSRALEKIPDDWLLFVFASDDWCGGVCLDAGFVTSVVQMQTICEVTADAPQPRKFTDTDAAMVIPLVEAALARTSALLQETGHSALAGFEYRSRSADVRELGLSLVEDHYRVFDLTVEMAGGVRQGKISLLVPVEAVEPAPDQEPQSEMGPTLQQASGVVRAELNAVICKTSLPLSVLSDMAVGSVLPLTNAKLNLTEVLTIDRSRVGIGRLGQSGGMRAVRLNERHAPSGPAELPRPEFIDAGPIASAPATPEPDIQIDDPMALTAHSLESDLLLTDSEDMAAQISQLAGLTISEGSDG